jgi:hypothetical protein
MKRASSLGTAACTLAMLIVGAQVHADEGDDLIKQGIECRRKRDDVCGLRLFEKAYEQGHTPRALAQIALAEQALGKWVVASEHLRQVLAIQGDAWIEKNRAVLNDSAARVAAHVGFIEIFGGPPGAEVRVDGTARGTLPLTRPLATTIGAVSLELVLPGRPPVRRATEVQAGETTREAFDEVQVESTAKSGGGARDASAIAHRPGIAMDRAPLASERFQHLAGGRRNRTRTSRGGERVRGQGASPGSRLSSLATRHRYGCSVGRGADLCDGGICEVVRQRGFIQPHGVRSPPERSR